MFVLKSTRNVSKSIINGAISRQLSAQRTQQVIGALSGIKVVDLTRILAGPFCTQMLGDLGAEVIKIERPKVGDETRQWGPPYAGGHACYFMACNRNKKVTLN